MPRVQRFAALYARISLDRQDGAGVDRQLADGRQLAEKRGWQVEEYVDNSISAYNKKRRPEWERLLADLRSGKLNAVVAYHPDRLYRKLSDLEELIDAVQTANAEVATVVAGDIDLSNASGRMMARILGSVSRHESERIGERVSRAKAQNAARGTPAGGGRRPYGLTADRSALVPEEAREALKVAKRVRDGVAGWAAEADRLNAAGITTASGANWTAGSLRQAIVSPHAAGLRSYKGDIVGEASWPAMIPRDVWDELRDRYLRGKRGRPPSDRHLLTGLLRCGRCGFRLYVTESHARNVRNYRCSPAPTSKGKGCGKLSISASVLENYVETVIQQWAARPDFLSGVHDAAGQPKPADETREDLVRRRHRLSELWAQGEIGDFEYDTGRATLARRIAELEANVVHLPRPAGRIGKLVANWQRLTIPERRTLIGELVETPIVVAPGIPGGGPVSDRVTLHEAWS